MSLCTHQNSGIPLWGWPGELSSTISRNCKGHTSWISKNTANALQILKRMTMTRRWTGWKRVCFRSELMTQMLCTWSNLLTRTLSGWILFGAADDQLQTLTWSCTQDHSVTLLPNTGIYRSCALPGWSLAPTIHSTSHWCMNEPRSVILTSHNTNVRHVTSAGNHTCYKPSKYEIQ